MLVGLWLAVSPFFLGFAVYSGALWNSVIVGVAVLLLAGSREMGDGYKVAWPSWVNAILGLWLIASPFIIGYSFLQTALWNHVIAGALVVVLATWSALATPREGM
jgi:hypothetical protein